MTAATERLTFTPKLIRCCERNYRDSPPNPVPAWDVITAIFAAYD
jgi:hypothetical protein